MYYQMTEQIKRRMILELRRFWSTHPRYPDLAEHIQGKYSFKERPQYGIVLKSASANHVQLSADNFVGTVQSHVMLVRVDQAPGLSAEWVRDDELAIQRNQGAFPSPAGIYYIEVSVSSEPRPPGDPGYQFHVDPLLDVVDENLLRVNDLEYQTQNPVLAGSMRLYEMPGSIPLVEGVNYTLDAPTGKVTLVTPVTRRGSLSADYRYVAPTTGPWPLTMNQANHTAIPGAIIAFGRRVQAGDRIAVVVSTFREPTALEYGGRWELSIDFDILARDVFAQQEIADATVMYLWGVARNRLSSEGIEITQVNFGGESEESYDDTGDDYYYNASFSVSLQADWSIHVPLAAYIRNVTPQTAAQIRSNAALSPEALAALGNAATSIELLGSMGLRAVEDPYFMGPAGAPGAQTTFEGIS